MSEQGGTEGMKEKAFGERPSAPPFIYTFTKACTACFQTDKDAEGTVLVPLRFIHKYAKFLNVTLRGTAPDGIVFGEGGDACMWQNLHLTWAQSLGASGGS